MSKLIVSIATPPGESAIGIIRLSGEQCLEIAQSIFQSSSKKLVNQYPQRTMIYGHIIDNEKKYDEVMICYFEGPRSFTRENMIEIYSHGSSISLREILNLLISKGASPAEPGEFTKRAFLNGRIDLSQAEAIMDLISAKTKLGFDIAISQMEGSITNYLNDISEVLTNLMAQIEVLIDYPDEDVEIISNTSIRILLEQLEEKLNNIIVSYGTGKIIRDGISIVIIGKPNVGKSSLLNALLRESRAIVTHIPGTTRDIIEESLNIKGIPIKLIDTAGIRETEDMIEKIGVERTKIFFNKSDMALLVLNASESLSQEDEDIIAIVKDKMNLVIVNKVDLDVIIDIDRVRTLLPNAYIIETSLVFEKGISTVEDAIESIILSGRLISKSGVILTNARQFEAALNANEAIKSALNALNNQFPLDLVEVDLMNAYAYVGEITGKSANEDIINRIFEKFCLGK